jgi:hypothetical protein
LAVPGFICAVDRALSEVKVLRLPGKYSFFLTF